MTTKESLINQIMEMKSERSGLRMRICGLESDLEAAQAQIDNLTADRQTQAAEFTRWAEHTKRLKSRIYVLELEIVRLHRINAGDV